MESGQENHFSNRITQKKHVAKYDEEQKQDTRLYII